MCKTNTNFAFKIMMEAELQKTLHVLKQGGLIVYPTDTVWGIGCDATNKTAVAKIFKIKEREESKSLVILVDGIEMLKNYIAQFPNQVDKILSSSNRPTTIVYSNPKGLAKNAIAHDNTIAIRIVNHNFCKTLIAKFGKPIVSTSANISNFSTPKSFKEIDKSILEAVDYVVNLDRDKIMDKPSRIIKILEEGTLQIIRD
ncbi:L-threonylcarbamoyladenylate synthase [Aureibaculum marinum]|nr:L-threonylcarbamoyladenylate synthase [Aureibaculum marinum]